MTLQHVAEKRHPKQRLKIDDQNAKQRNTANGVEPGKPLPTTRR